MRPKLGAFQIKLGREDLPRENTEAKLTNCNFIDQLSSGCLQFTAIELVQTASCIVRLTYIIYIQCLLRISRSLFHNVAHTITV